MRCHMNGLGVDGHDGGVLEVGHGRRLKGYQTGIDQVIEVHVGWEAGICQFVWLNAIRKCNCF